MAFCQFFIGFVNGNRGQSRGVTRFFKGKESFKIMAISDKDEQGKKEFLDRYSWFDPYDLLEYLSNTTEDSWCMDVVKNNKGQSCFFGHVFDWGGGDKNLQRANDAMNLFEAVFATEFMVYPINDGRATRYPQRSPKQRCLAYFRDLLDGREKTTLELMNEG